MKKIFTVLLTLLVTSSPAFAAGNAEAGKEKAAACIACHGDGGNSTISINPILAGQHRSYLVQALNDYKSGKRSNPIMRGMSAALSEQDIEDLAAYFAAQAGLQ